MRASRGCSTMLSNQAFEVDLPLVVGEYTVRSDPCRPASVFVGRIRPAASRLLMDRYTNGLRTLSTATSDSSALSSLAMANPCCGFSLMSARTMWSRTDGVYSLTVTILAKLPKVLLAVCTGLTAMPSSAHAVPLAQSKTTITVSAAASLNRAFTEIGKQFEKANPSIKVRFNFGSSSSLVSQIQSGAPTDVFAAADLASFDKLLASGNVVKSPRVFARNSMQLVVKSGNPLGIRTVNDLNKASTISLCAKTIPCGLYAAAVLSRHGVSLSESNISRGIDATATLNAVSTGDADAALVYVTDAISARKLVTAIAIPASKNVKALYGIGVVRGGKNSQQSERFLAYVLSNSGQKILASFGFQAP